jgi:hypothetical protein
MSEATKRCPVCHGDLPRVPTPHYSCHVKLRATLEAQISELCDALEDLMDWQNGPPLSSYKWVTGWGDAMATAERLLVVHGRKEVTP